MLEVRGITKTYGGVTALREASFRVRPGTVHALLGENSAGKSTLVKIIAGAVRQDSGVLELDGVPVSFSSTADAARNGVAVVSQELALFPDLDVLLNLFSTGPLRRGPLLSRAAMAARAAPVLKELGLEVDVGRLAGPCPWLTGSGSRSAAPCSPTRGSWCSTSPPPRWSRPAPRTC